jgi:hypothetical protein
MITVHHSGEVGWPDPLDIEGSRWQLELGWPDSFIEGSRWQLMAGAVPLSQLPGRNVDPSDYVDPTDLDAGIGGLP